MKKLLIRRKPGLSASGPHLEVISSTKDAYYAKWVNHQIFKSTTPEDTYYIMKNHSVIIPYTAIKITKSQFKIVTENIDLCGKLYIHPTKTMDDIYNNRQEEVRRTGIVLKLYTNKNYVFVKITESVLTRYRMVYSTYKPNLVKDYVVIYEVL